MQRCLGHRHAPRCLVDADPVPTVVSSIVLTILFWNDSGSITEWAGSKTAVAVLNDRPPAPSAGRCAGGVVDVKAEFAM